MRSRRLGGEKPRPAAKLMPNRPTYSSITPRQIRVIGVPLDLGQSRRGVDMGPSAVRVAGLEARLEGIGHIVEDAGNVAVALPEQKKEGEASAKYLKEITATCTKSADLCSRRSKPAKSLSCLAEITPLRPALFRGFRSFIGVKGRKSACFGSTRTPI